MRISGIEYESIVDGPGLRNTIFVSGCEHHCKGCHNPETWDPTTGQIFTKEMQNDFINKYVIGVDKGALYCLENNIKMDCAIGDYDSIDEKPYIEINKITKVIKLNPIKDETDTQPCHS